MPQSSRIYLFISAFFYLYSFISQYSSIYLSFSEYLGFLLFSQMLQIFPHLNIFSAAFSTQKS